MTTGRRYSIGLDYGTNSVRALLVDVQDGTEIATSVWTYKHGEKGVILSRDPNLARQHPQDYLDGAQITIKAILKEAKQKIKNFSPDQIVGIGIDTTGSTPIPVDYEGWPLVFHDEFKDDLNAMAWLWKDHTAVAEAEEITEKARQLRPQYLSKYGGKYSSEWFWSKILHCKRVAPKVFNSAYAWLEAADWIPGVLTGNQAPHRIRIGICAVGHKAMYNEEWGGYPDKEFLNVLDPALAELRDRLPQKTYTVADKAGELTPQWAKKLGLPSGIPVAVGAFDAHLGAVGAGIQPGTLVKIIGTSTCDMMVAPIHKTLPDIPGLCGIVKGSILPGYYGLEAGQSAVGDIFNWFVEYIKPGGPKLGSHEALTQAAAQLRAGESGLLALDWNNGNRTILVDQRLTGLLIGQTLYTSPSEIYRALIEATAFGALTIINRFEEYGLKVKQVINCGGIAEKNPLVMQIYADVTGRVMRISRSSQTCALGSAIAGAVVGGVYKSFKEAQKAICGLKEEEYRPNPTAHKVYKELYELYKILHDAFGTPEWQGNLYCVMKKLIDIRDRVRLGGARKLK